MNDAKEILGRLIAFKTDNQAEGNKACVEYICSLLQQNNVLFERLVNPINQKENIIAGINVSDLCNIRGGLVLSGHTDTVGVNLSEWRSNPFEATSENGKIYGRGSVDMKYFIACVLAMIPTFQKADFPVLFLFSGDEETDVEGIQTLCRYMQKHNICPQYALVGEPTDFNICTAHRGYAGFMTTITGTAAHSGNPELGCNAIYVAAKIVAEIERLNAEYMPVGTTLNVGIIRGGEGRNSVASKVMFDWDIRYQTEEHKEEILQQLTALQENLQKTYKNAVFDRQTAENLPSFASQKDSAFGKILKGVLQTDEIQLPYATEAGFLQKAGIDTIICGAGQPQLAHGADEYISQESLDAYMRFLEKIIDEIF